MKNKVVVFKDGWARILTNPKKELLSSLKDPHVSNPDLSLVAKLSPEYWKLEDDKVVPMSDEEKAQRKQELKRHSPKKAKKDQGKTKAPTPSQLLPSRTKPPTEAPIALKEVLIEVPVPVTIEVIKEVIKEVPVEVVRVEQVEVIKEVKQVPKWMWLLLGASLVANLVLALL